MTLRPLVVSALVGVAILGCHRSSPTAAFHAWLESVHRCDLEGMKAALTEESLKQVDALSNGLRGLAPQERQATFHILTELCRGYQPGSFQVLGEQVDGETATLRLKAKDRTLEARMQREGEAWKLDFASMMRQAVSGSFGLRPPEPTPTSAPAAAPPPASPAAEPPAPSGTP